MQQTSIEIRVEWAVMILNKINPKVFQMSFLKCCISNTLDTTEDYNMLINHSDVDGENDTKLKDMTGKINKAEYDNLFYIIR